MENKLKYRSGKYGVIAKSVWTDGSLDEIEYLRFRKDMNYIIRPKFLVDEPEIGYNSKDKRYFVFKVLDLDTNKKMLLKTSATSFMRALREHLPLKGKALFIKAALTSEWPGFEIKEIIDWGFE